MLKAAAKNSYFVNHFSYVISAFRFQEKEESGT